MRRSTVLRSPVQLVFPGLSANCGQRYKSFLGVIYATHRVPSVKIFGNKVLGMYITPIKKIALTHVACTLNIL